MVRKTAIPNTISEIYLLPDEVCLAEAQYALFELHCEREGFHFFDWGCIDISISCHIFLTDTRLVFQPLKREKKSAFSICIEAIRNPRLEQFNYHFSGGGTLLVFEVCLEHGISGSPSDMNGTPSSLIAKKGRPQDVKKCEVACIFSIRRLADLFLRGIKLDLQKGMSCPTRRCRFIDYEDLPTYSAASDSDHHDMPVDKLPVYSIADYQQPVK